MTTPKRSDAADMGGSESQGARLDRLCIHTITTRPLSLQEAVDEYAASGVHGITVWRDAIPSDGPAAARRLIERAGLKAVALCRGGFFVHPEEEGRAASIEENRTILAEAAEIGAPMVVLVCGAHPDVELKTAREQIKQAIEALVPTAEETGVRLAIEPLHPMYADTRSAVNTMKSANDIAEQIRHELVGVAVDVYHTWWDPDLESQIDRCGDRIFAFHVCDWRSPTRDLLNDRTLMGEGCIPIRRIRGWVERNGFTGFNEVEIFSTELWSRDQHDYVENIVESYRACV